MPHDEPPYALPWIQDHEALPPVTQTWGANSPAPGLLAAGHELTVTRLLESYSHGIFPWFSVDQPILWWSPDPRMVLRPQGLRITRSLAKTLRNAHYEVRLDTAFAEVIAACGSAPRDGQNGTWIVPEMVAAYENLHRQGYAHSAEVWLDGQLVAGLYFVALGHAVFGESMFTTIPNGSKMALACLVSVCLEHGIPMIACQQNTRHLASLGAREMARTEFMEGITRERQQSPVDWALQSLYWDSLMALDNCA